MNVFPRFSALTPIEWAIVFWFFASILWSVWVRLHRKKVPLGWVLASVLNVLAAAAFYQGILR